MLEVMQPGLSTTVQDVGRQNCLSLGVPPSGAQDNFSMRIANLLVANPAGGPLLLREHVGSAGLEVLLIGPTLRALDRCLVAVTGGVAPVKINDRLVDQWRALLLQA